MILYQVGFQKRTLSLHKYFLRSIFFSCCVRLCSRVLLDYIHSDEMFAFQIEYSFPQKQKSYDSQCNFQIFFACNNTGGITVDGQNIKELDLKSLRRNIGSVSQEPALFSATIMDNLRIGKLDATDEEIIEAAKTANVHSFISKLPDQYSTEVRLYVCKRLVTTSQISLFCMVVNQIISSY